MLSMQELTPELLSGENSSTVKYQVKEAIIKKKIQFLIFPIWKRFEESFILAGLENNQTIRQDQVMEFIQHAVKMVWNYVQK